VCMLEIIIIFPTVFPPFVLKSTRGIESNIPPSKTVQHNSMKHYSALCYHTNKNVQNVKIMNEWMRENGVMCIK
jgi:hypothetical protein